MVAIQAPVGGGTPTPTPTASPSPTATATASSTPTPKRLHLRLHLQLRQHSPRLRHSPHFKHHALHQCVSDPRSNHTASYRPADIAVAGRHSHHSAFPFHFHLVPTSFRQRRYLVQSAINFKTLMTPDQMPAIGSAHDYTICSRIEQPVFSWTAARMLTSISRTCSNHIFDIE